MSLSPKYLAYLIRLWREGDSKSWRATLQNPHTGERRSFSDLATLLSFLEEQTHERRTPCQQQDDNHHREGGDKQPTHK